jgi:hypothetical protein
MTIPSILRHVVLFGFKPGTSEQETDEIVRRVCALRHQVPGILALEWGVNVSPEGLAKGHSHCFTLTFETAEARDAYLPHPDHAAFVAWVGPVIETVTVLDYWANVTLP